MNKLRDRFLIEFGLTLIIFIVGVLYLSVPVYYGIDKISDINSNNMFMSLMIIYSVIEIFDYMLIKKNPNNEKLLLGIAAVVSCIVCLILSRLIAISACLPMSLLIFTVLYFACKLFTIDYYHDRKNSYYLIELVFSIIILIVGVVLSVNMLNNVVVHSIMLGFFLIMVGVIEAINSCIKYIIKTDVFLKSVK